MSNIIDYIFDAKHAEGRAYKVAYSLNNSQPVLCSIISDEPLFYLDFEDDDIEEDLELFDFTDIEAGVDALKRRITDLSAPVITIAADSIQDRIEAFQHNIAEILSPAGFSVVDSKSDDIDILLADMRKSRLAASFIEFAQNHGTRFIYDSQIMDAHYNRVQAVIAVNPSLCRDDKILLLARELRRVWQHRNGGMLNPLSFQPDQAVLVNRAQIADLSVIMVRIAWELQLAGDKAIWERLENSSMADLARVFARESYLDFRSLNNGSAQSAVFETWFLSERCRHEDRKLIQAMLADYQGYVFESEETSITVMTELIGALGTMPFGKNYLIPYIHTITGDAIFTEIRDRSNANFLWFIKFEKTFRETEQELQTAKTGHDVHRDLDNKNKTSKERFGDHEQETQIITLPFGGAGTTSAQNLTGKSRQDIRSVRTGKNIIPFTGKH